MITTSILSFSNRVVKMPAFLELMKPGIMWYINDYINFDLNVSHKKSYVLFKCVSQA